MRIVGGRLRGKKLAEVGAGDSSAHLRPTSDRVRENLFNLLINGSSGNLVAGARVLDLCAGTGALGLEALSRGARGVTFIDRGRAALKLIAANITLCRAEAETEVIPADVLDLPMNRNPGFDLVFLDPPYGQGFVPKVLAALKTRDWLAGNATIVVEENVEILAENGFLQLDHRRYGDTHLHLFELSD